jgi:thioredoxin-related protein
MFKKTILGLTAMLALNAQAEVKMHDLTDEEYKVFESAFINSMTGGDKDRNMTIEHVKQLNDTDNYLLKVKEGQGTYTMLYIKDLDSIVIHGSGELYDIQSESFVTKQYQADLIAPILEAKIDKKDLITYSPKEINEDTDEIYVFSDPTCGYCRKLHQEIDDYTDRNIKVNYLPFPRNGTSGQGFEMLVNAYCSDDREAAFEHIKTKTTPIELPKDITEEKLNECREIVKKYYDLGAEIGVKGTPAIFDKNGQQQGGYIPAFQLKMILNQ